MWVESTQQNRQMQQIRKINNTEKAILEYLVKKGSFQLPNEWNQNLFVQQMDDGGMGSFLIFKNTFDTGVKRNFGKQVSDFEFVDDDGVLVLVSLNTDEQNQLYEVDVWKTNYAPVINLKVPI